jgi:hypothetical protein
MGTVRSNTFTVGLLGLGQARRVDPSCMLGVARQALVDMGYQVRTSSSILSDSERMQTGEAYILKSSNPSHGGLEVMLREEEPYWAGQDNKGSWGLSVSWYTPILSTSFLARLLDPRMLNVTIDTGFAAIQTALRKAGYSCVQYC